MGYLGQEPTEPRRPDQGPRTSSQFLQVGYRLQTQDSLKMKLQSMSNKSTDHNVEEISASKVQVYRQRMTIHKANDKDEKEQRRDCKAESQPYLTRQASSSCSCTKLAKLNSAPLNPVTDLQFLTLIYNIKRLHTIAEVPITSICGYVSG